MGIKDFFTGIVNSKQEKYRSLTQDMRNCISFIDAVLDSKGIIEKSQYSGRLSDLSIIKGEADILDNRIVLIEHNAVTEFRAVYREFGIKLNSFESDIEAHNAAILREKIQSVRNIIGKIEGHDLDDQQMMFIMKDAHNHNVVAGAGTGKTTTIIGKVKYLLAFGKCAPKDILVLSYTRDAANEMKVRLKRNTNEDIAVSTFHAFGYKLVGHVEGKKPDIYTDSVKSILEASLTDLVSTDRKYLRRFLSYMSNGGYGKSDLDDSFSSPEEYFEYLNSHPPMTLKGERVKSFGEVHVANILSLNGIRYEYERPYEVDTADSEYAQYHPDFYLPQYRIYIEFFGINRAGKVPDWFEGEDPSRRYIDGIKWKRKTHKRNHTTMIECYAYEDAEGILEDNLLARLKENGVDIKPLTAEDIISDSNKDANRLLGRFLSTSEKIINLAKNNKYTSEMLIQKAIGNKDSRILAELIAPLFDSYNGYHVISGWGPRDFRVGPT